ncbi:streptomycin 3-adenylyltransferase [Sinosporangium album]|uniref:Streptomycin 3-adenylyltransferase n=1 Tax=Sinosporangium album TaxID=504805 RepID=A0A1G7QNH2_9ACTN|nr:aminoglycoside adenylyltransferase family protein [Sinosporangium album]SDG00066.1 streptomycin 3-adenylyltransferase [Sinosporangium album]
MGEGAGTQAADVVGLVREVLGADVVGAYMLGSAVLGGLRSSSDVDVFAVVRRPVAGEERRTLVDRLMAISGPVAAPGGARPVELTIVVQSEVRPWRYPPVCEFQYGEWLREEYERGEVPVPVASPDLATLITMVLQGDTALYGPPPREVLDAVPQKDLARGSAAVVPELLEELETDTRNAVLTLTRVWSTLATGEIRSKDTAAAWALGRLPEERRPVLAHARAVYLGEERERWDDLLPGLRPYADHVIAEIDSLTPTD